MRICVFCGSRSTADSRYLSAAADLGRTLALRGIGLVYGGSTRGLMGIVANTCLEYGGAVTGVMPNFLIEREAPHPFLTELRIVESLSERKSLMTELSGAFIVLPGGFGTIDEAFEVLASAQVGLHAKPCIFLDIAGFFRHLLEFIDQASSEGFIAPQHRMLVIQSDTVEGAVNAAQITLAPAFSA